ncbi:MAG: restriction endonuclease subunit S [Flintibacter sp.]|uniref:restriction endonuclease subunit S n=1 Tax=Flintibacter sp. TaxID=1918624 RepID=UPI002672FAFE|nr:restriction endonuclease subunit S [Flintibacter sp.]MCI6149636.1 restriction endonuclease subunit S [Flintibacter sp.]MDY5039321.1 restriction endonuclease subunit S [Lawsonibacter sp.]
MTSKIKQRIEQIRYGNVPDGYKKAKAGILPADWDVYMLGECLSRVERPVEVKPNELYTQIGIRSHGKGLFYKEPVTGAALGNKAVFWIEPDCFIVNIVFAWEQAIGKTTQSEVGMIGSHRFPMYRPVNDRVDIDYLISYFLTKRGTDILEAASPGGAGRNKTLGQERFLKSKIVLPPIEEQQKIAAILTTQDRVIELKEKRLAEKQRQKKYLMQQLLTGKKRLPGFSGEWKNIKLCEVLSERKEKNVEQNLRICSVAVQKGVVDQVEHLGRSYAANDTSNYSVAHYGDIIYTKSPTGDFLYGIVKQNLLQETVAVSPLYGVFTPLTFGLGYFLHTYFQSAICARNYLLPIVQKGAKNTINITNDTFISSKLYLPLDVEEQKAIADTFIAADREIDLLRQDIEQEKQKKKALMQMLLTGIVRVNV